MTEDRDKLRKYTYVHGVPMGGVWFRGSEGRTYGECGSASV